MKNREVAISRQPSAISNQQSARALMTWRALIILLIRYLPNVESAPLDPDWLITDS